MEIDQNLFQFPISTRDAVHEKNCTLRVKSTKKRRRSSTKDEETRGMHPHIKSSFRNGMNHARVISEEDMEVVFEPSFINLSKPVYVVNGIGGINEIHKLPILFSSFVLCFFGNVSGDYGYVDNVPLHISAISHFYPCLQSYNTDVIGITTDTVENICQWKAHLPRALQFSLPVISDSNDEICREMGMLHPLGGAKLALDAIVIIDSVGRRRDILPIRTTTCVSTLITAVQETVRFLAIENGKLL